MRTCLAFCGFWVSQLRLSHLGDRHFADWAICSVLWVVLSAYGLVPVLGCLDFKLGIVTPHFSCDFLDLCPWHIPWHWFCKPLFTNIYHTEGKVGFSWDLSKVTDQETDVFTRLLMHKIMFLPVFVLFWSAVSCLLIVYLVLVFTDIWLTNKFSLCLKYVFKDIWGGGLTL